MITIPGSLQTVGDTEYFLAQERLTRRPGERYLGVRGPDRDFTDLHNSTEGVRYYALSEANAAGMRQRLGWLNPASLGAGLSFGFGDRLGLATPGHIQALRSVLGRQESAFKPVFAQQSVRENARTERTPQQVLDDAMWGAFQEGWGQPWGADADHLKEVSSFSAFVRAGYSFFTVDPGDYVDAGADIESLSQLKVKAAALPWDILHSNPDENRAAYVGQSLNLDGMPLEVDEAAYLRAAAKYGQAIAHVAKMYWALLECKPDGFDFEVSVDETETPTSILEHFYIASELKRLGVRWTSLAPRFPGRFEKGVDFIGDLVQLEREIAWHAAVVRFFGNYKLSLHSGSDKFSVYPLLARHAERNVHIKTAGTSYLEALRVIAGLDPALFRQILELARQRYPIDRQSYHVSADEGQIPLAADLADEALSGLLEDFHAREALHVTYGSALAQFKPLIIKILEAHPQRYMETLRSHFERHLAPFIKQAGA
ncbi:MAG: hypothetical protein JXB15_02805 [Anaerolineales bacterium]|nr:hypothetical protein [Anaerolineales bacterium]